MLKDSQGRRLWIVDELGGHAPVNSHADIQNRTRGHGEPDWWVVAKDKNWTPPEPRSLLRLGAAGESSGGGSGGETTSGTKIGAGHKPQPCGEHGWYGATGGGASSGPVHRGKVTPPIQTGKVAASPPSAPPKSPLGQGPERGQDVGKHYMLPPEVKAENARTALVYSQSDGKLMDMEDRLVGQGYSGAPGYVNKPELQGKVDQGVIPEGTYTIGDVISDSKQARGMGPDVIKLEPDPVTANRIRAMGRDPNTFYIHGDNGKKNQSASEGCIIMDKYERKALKELQGARIRVVR